MGLFSNATASFTERDLPDQTGKVFIVTGATSGIGEILTRFLYAKNAKVYLAARTASKADGVIKSIQQQYPQSRGALVFLSLDLNDLSTIKASAEEFLAKEDKLDALWNNAGVMRPPQGSKTKQGYELQLGTNNLAPFLFTKLLTPILQQTAKTALKDSVRVVWVSSSAAANFAPKDGVVMDNLDYKKDQSAWHKYGVSKAGNILHAAEYARRYGPEGIISVSLDPGYLKTPLYNNMPAYQKTFMGLFLKEPVNGTYTELFAGFSPEVTSKRNGSFILPFGKLGTARSDIEMSRKSKAEGGNGRAEEFWKWSEEQVASYA